MKQVSGVQLLSVGGVDRVDYTWMEIDDSTGDIISMNNKATFVITDASLKKHADAIREFIRDNKLSD